MSTLQLLCKICALSVLCCSLASGYEIVIDSTYYKDGRDDSKQVVFDPNTALIWQDDESAKSVTEDWQGAIKHCQNLNFAGYSDWRLPSREELRTIVDKNNSPAIKSEFKNTASLHYWSSTPNADYSGNAWNIRFSHGYEGSNDKDDSNNVRCVR